MFGIAQNYRIAKVKDPSGRYSLIVFAFPEV
jgi:hypothetical protein